MSMRPACLPKSGVSLGMGSSLVACCCGATHGSCMLVRWQEVPVSHAALVEPHVPCLDTNGSCVGDSTFARAQTCRHVRQRGLFEASPSFIKLSSGAYQHQQCLPRRTQPMHKQQALQTETRAPDTKHPTPEASLPFRITTSLHSTPATL